MQGLKITLETNNTRSVVEENVEVQGEDPQVTIMKLRNQIENYKLKMADFSKYVQQIQVEKRKGLQKNNEKINVVGEKIVSHMSAFGNALMEKVKKPLTTDVERKQLEEELWTDTENTALDMIEEIKFIIHEGASFNPNNFITYD